VLKIDENGKNAVSRRSFLAENGIFALFSLKIQTWTTMPLKVGFIPGFRGLLSDISICSLPNYSITFDYTCTNRWDTMIFHFILNSPVNPCIVGFMPGIQTTHDTDD